ncbi:hypothetical protein GYH30_029916 [Glycine max]|uniref:Uncharacterized protein n=1 Tax=Glycine max TaxID=3847 RepID=K7LMV6_SOYBN|nr:hypothetical protein GYH30_029916 [Glycine max]
MQKLKQEKEHRHLFANLSQLGCLCYCAPFFVCFLIDGSIDWNHGFISSADTFTWPMILFLCLPFVF